MVIACILQLMKEASDFQVIFIRIGFVILQILKCKYWKNLIAILRWIILSNQGQDDVVIDFGKEIEYNLRCASTKKIIMRKRKRFFWFASLFTKLIKMDITWKSI